MTGVMMRVAMQVIIGRKVVLASVALALVATVAQASWYDDYDAGLAAVRAGNWSLVVQKMSAAIKAMPNEDSRARTYGMDFRNYHPYYYRGVAYINIGKYDEAISDLEKTKGPGPENLGTIESLMARAKREAAAAAAPPEPVRQSPVTQQPPAGPQINSALRDRAAAAIAAAKQKLGAAQQRGAGGTDAYRQALSAFAEASSKSTNARTNDDLNAAIAAATNAGDIADLASAPVAPSSPGRQPTPTPSPITPRSTAATTTVMQDDASEVREALEYYFAGEFEEASRRFESLTHKMPRNGWIWAFLGASQYSQYAFEIDERYKRAAEQSFRKARQYGAWADGLPSKYFSKRIRRAFRDTSG